MAVELSVNGLDLAWDGQPIVRDVSFELERGSIMCLVGRSGTGKTTLFHALAGLSKPESGTILLEGTDIAGLPGKISYMQQKDLLIPSKTIIDNAALPLIIHHVKKAEARAAARELFPAFGLEGTEDLYPDQLSGGMRQRVALLRTYMMKNNVILMDEPFSAIDAITRQDLRLWMSDMLTRLGLTAIIITHDVDDAIALADGISVLAGNPAQGKPSTIVGTFEIKAPRDERSAFMMTKESLDLKASVLELLETTSA